MTIKEAIIQALDGLDDVRMEYALSYVQFLQAQKDDAEAETQEILQNHNWMEKIRKGTDDIQAGKFSPLEELL